MKVLDLSCDVAGRFAARLFAWGGAEVLRCGADLPEPDSLSLYLDAGRQTVSPAQIPALLPQCDLIFTSFDQGQYRGHAKNLAIPQTAVHVTTSSYGATGPYAAWRGGSLADWAAGGYLFITGDADREPLSGPENLCAYAAGYTAAAGAEAALIDRMREGSPESEIRPAVVEGALAHHLVSRYTSLVAVDVTPMVPVDAVTGATALPTRLPEGMSYEAIFGGGPQTATPATLQLIAGLGALFAAMLLGARWRRAARRDF